MNEVQAKEAADVSKVCRERLSNQHYLPSLGQALEAGSGLSLLHFAVTDEYALKPLLAHDRHYFMEVGAPCPPLPAGDPAGRKRGCIFDRRTGKTRLELPMELDAEGRVFRPAIHCASDDGPIGRPSMHYMYNDLHIRGTRVAYDSHKMHNLVKMACVEAGVYVVVLEATVGFNLPGGPWEGDVFKGLQQAGEKFLATPVLTILLPAPSGGAPLGAWGPSQACGCSHAGPL